MCLVVTLAAGAQTIRIPDFRQAPPAVTALKPGESCGACGRILSLKEVPVQRGASVPQAFRSDAPGSSSGPAQPNLVGAVIYLPLGDEPSERPFVGGVGTPEMRARFRETTYEITVQLDDGALRVVQRHDGAHYRVGDRVRLPAPGKIELVTE